MKYNINDTIINNKNLLQIIDREIIHGFNIYYLEDGSSVEETQVSYPSVEDLVFLSNEKIKKTIKNHPGLQKFKIILKEWEIEKKQKQKESEILYKIKKYFIFLLNPKNKDNRL